MSRNTIGLIITIVLAGLAGWSTTLFMEPGTLASLLTPILLGGIIGIVGRKLTRMWEEYAFESEI